MIIFSPGTSLLELNLRRTPNSDHYTKLAIPKCPKKTVEQSAAQTSQCLKSDSFVFFSEMT